MSSKAEELELRISYFLRYGVLVAGALMLVGWLGHVDFASSPLVDFAHYHDLPLAQELSQAFANRDWAALMAFAGLFCLISLPIIRVFLIAVLFVKEADYKMAALASFVFGILILSFVLGVHFE